MVNSYHNIIYNLTFTIHIKQNADLTLCNYCVCGTNKEVEDLKFEDKKKLYEGLVKCCCNTKAILNHSLNVIWITNAVTSMPKQTNTGYFVV